MSRINARVAQTLRQFAAALALQGAHRFKVKAYRKAAETVETLEHDVAAMVRAGADLKALHGVGQAISRSIQEIVTTGKHPQLERALGTLSPEMVELTTHPSLDPKKILRIYKRLGISHVAALRKRLDSGDILKTFGTRMEHHVRQGLDTRPRMLLWTAEVWAHKIENYLTAHPEVTRVARAGSLRRKQDTVGDLNFLAAGSSAAVVFRRFSRFGAVQAMKQLAKNKKLFQLSSGLTGTLTWSPRTAWGLTLLLETGSAAHVKELRGWAKKKRGDLTRRSMSAKKIDTTEERPVYTSLGLPFIEPELREGRGEIQSGATGTLPTLIALKDLRGDLHMHTTESDGANTLNEMVEAAQERGYEYVAITDHSQSLKITNGLSPKRLLRQIKRIDRLNDRMHKFRVLKSAEVDILEDGRLDYPDIVLKELDLTICSIHSRLGLNKQQQTTRILRAMDNPYFNILGHATGRKLLKRDAYDLDMDKVMKHARACGCYFEINSSPDRLDLSDEHARVAKNTGILIAINTDAHSTAELDFVQAGLNQARRGWLEPGDVLNTLTVAQLLRKLRR